MTTHAQAQMGSPLTLPTQLLQKTRTWLLAIVSSFLTMAVATAAAPVRFTDDFEGESLNPFWTRYQASGVFTFPATARAHSGRQSVELRTVRTGAPMEVQLNSDFSAPAYGKVSFSVYDAAADDLSGTYLRFYLRIPGGGGYEIMIFTNDYDLGPTNGGTYYINTPGSTGPVTIKTSIDRTKAWHHWEIISQPNLLEYRIDGQVVHSSTTGYAFTGITFSNGAPAFRPGVTAYVDDFEFDPESDFAAIDPNPTLLTQAGEILAPLSAAAVDQIAAATSTRTGVVADGVTPLILRLPSSSPVTFSLTPNSSVSNGQLDLLPSGGLPGTTVTAQPVQDTTGRSWVFAVYTAPDSLDPSGPAAQSVNIQAQRTTDTRNLELALKAPPIVLVHGIWSNPQDAWWNSGFVDSLQSNFYHVVAANYEYANAADFNPRLPRNLNLPVARVERAIRIARQQSRDRGIAATQVVLVGHSMGGLVSRAWVASPDYKRADNFMLGNVQKLITFGTPHLGTDLATWLTTHKDDVLAGNVLYPGLPFPVGITIEDLFSILSKPLGPAVYALQTNSPSIANLGSQGVPTHAIVCVAPSSSRAEWVLDFIPRLAGHLLTTIDGLLGGNLNHDTLVTLSSQAGGALGFASSTVTGVVHTDIDIVPGDTGETDSQAVQSRVLQLLAGGSFPPPPSPDAMGILNPGVRIAPDRSVAKTVTGASNFVSRSDGARVSLTPTAGTVVQPGDQVRIDFSILGGNAVAGCFVIVDEVVQTFQGPGPFSMTVEIPSVAAGLVKVTAFTFGGTPFNYGAETSILVRPTATLTAINVSPNSTELSFFGETAPLTVIGTYSDGIERDLSNASAGTSYTTLSGNAGIVAESENGVIEARGSGQEIVRISNAGVSEDVPVTVSITNTPPTLRQIGNLIVPAGTLLEIPISANDSNGNQMKLAMVSAPGFVTLTDAGNGTGVLRIAPTDQDLGHSSAAVLAAIDDGTPNLGATRQIPLTIAPRDPRNLIPMFFRGRTIEVPAYLARRYFEAGGTFGRNAASEP